MKLFSQNFSNGDVIPGKNAFAVPASEGHITLSQNASPHLAWDPIPPGTKSLALLCHDPDVPSRGDDVNQEGRVVSSTLPRIDFYHWILLDIPVTQQELAESAFSSGVTPKGKTLASLPAGYRHGINDYSLWFASDAQMSGDYHGYDGPCPPWNDEIVHRYVFTLYALDVASLPVDGALTGQNVRKAIESVNVLAQAELTGLYSLNPTVR
ncbi:YbhB/YbcL family Raf kinase inhibitor-like protein [Kosakonia sp. MUSA4]|uniref:YbhB/YbcL family Raf kinase inhibitor-like protein n=1 Tax=Kosakonia sp. MUSA4 TaxID=2067958 RepID=UPI0015991276|nr:YbhB/YbcL family Raf kinase inhibitor-like protein [Kosakonia sp. MUSA4]QJT82274.1 YbhB/YbcL family Raf kinase inhibitor-like protein [Kosakonia sp. MUSA4]